MNAAQARTAPLPFYGWRVVAASFTGQLVANACTFAPFGVFVIPLAEEFRTTRGAISNGLGIAMLAMGVLSPFIGRWVDRGPVRRLMLAGVALCSAGLLLLSRASELWQAGLLFCTAVSLGAALFGSLPSIALVGKWFVRRRGLALGVAVAGSTVSAAAAPALAAFLIDAVGWRHAIALFGAGALLVAAPVIALCVVRSPEDVGQHPDGAAEPLPEVEGEAASVSPRALLRDRNFRIVAIGFALLFTSPIVTTAHLVPFAEDLGVARRDASWVLSAAAVGSLLGKLVFGLVVDRVDPRHALYLAVALLAGAWVTLLGDPGYPSLLLAGSLMGLGIGAVIPINGVVVGRIFGRAGFGQVTGLGGLLSLPFVAASGPAAGRLYDLTGSYRVAFGAEIAVLLLAGVLFAGLRFPGEERRRAAASAVRA
jgi:MFS family permease